MSFSEFAETIQWSAQTNFVFASWSCVHHTLFPDAAGIAQSKDCFSVSFWSFVLSFGKTFRSFSDGPIVRTTLVSLFVYWCFQFSDISTSSASREKGTFSKATVFQTLGRGKEKKFVEKQVPDHPRRNSRHTENQPKRKQPPNYDRVDRCFALLFVSQFLLDRKNCPNLLAPNSSRTILLHKFTFIIYLLIYPSSGFIIFSQWRNPFFVSKSPNGVWR